MTEEHTYKGHTIVVDTHKVGQGWRWSYQIDGGELVSQKGDRPMGERIAIAEAIAEAEYAIDQMA